MMKSSDTLDKVQSLIKSMGIHRSGNSGKRVIVPCGPVVTIARDHGAGGNEAGRILAHELGVACLDQEILDRIAQLAKSDKTLMRRLDERLPLNFLEDWLHAIFSKRAPSQHGYQDRLIQVIQNVANIGGVILGRGAHLILNNRKNVFRLRITGSVDVCARRVAQQDGIDLEKARRMVVYINSERADFVKGLFKRFPSNRSYYDLVLNSDHLTPAEISGIVLFTMKRMGFHVPERKAADVRHSLDASDDESQPVRVTS